MGEDGVELYNTFDLEEAEKNDIEKVLQAFQNHCASKTNVLSESVKFLNRSQTNGETFDSFLKCLQKLSETCEYGNMRDRMIRDIFVAGIRDEALREKLLMISDLDLQKALEICRAAEASEAEAKTLEVTNVPEIKQKTDNGAKRKNVEQQPEQNFDCSRCGTSHCPKQCPAFKKKCKKCGGNNHFAVGCTADVTMKEEKTSEEKIDGIEEETNEAIIVSEATFRYTVKNFSKMKNPELSPPCYIRNFPWKIMVKPKGLDQKSLGFYLQCNGESESASWSCYAVAELRLLSNKEGTEPFSRKIQHLFYSKENDWGFSHFMTWQDVLEVKRGYIKDDSITLEVHVVADQPLGVK